MMKSAKKQVWSVNLTMTLQGDEPIVVKHDIDLSGDAGTVLRQIADCAVEVEESVNNAARTIVASAGGFGLKRGGGK